MATAPQPAPVETSDPGNELLEAFLGEEGYGLEDSKQFEARPTDEEGDQPDAEAPEDEEAEAEAAEEGDEEAEDEAAEEGEPDGEYVEHEGEQITVARLIDAYKFQQSHEKNLEGLRSEVINQARKEVDEQKSGWSKRLNDAEETYEFLQTLIPNYERPKLSMLDANSEDFDPNGYHYLNGQIDKIEARKAEAARKVQSIRAERDKEQADKQQARITENADKLKAEFPDFKGEKVAELATALKKHYGFDDATLASVVDYRFFKLAMDAAAYRASRDKGVPQPKVAKAAPKLVRSTAKPGVKAPSKRKADAEKALKKTGKITDREAIFGDFL